MITDDYILIKYIDNTLSDDEKASVEAWLNASPENMKILEQMYYTLQLTERLKVMNSVDTDKAFARFKDKTNRQKEKVGLNVSRLGLQQIAAILIIPLLVLAGYLYMRSDEDRLRMVEINTNPGVILIYDLPDGSKVWLNSGSSLKYAANFKENKRIVELKGEGYFDVIKDTDKPFVVKVTPSYSLEVLGTSFNVFAYPEEEIIETTLVNGSVKLHLLSENGKTSEHHLQPNEKAEYRKIDKKLDIAAINPEHNTGWKNGELIFRQYPMNRVLRTLSRHYNVQFDVKNPDVMNAVITARFKDEQLPQVLEYLKAASGIKYTIHKPLLNESDTIKTSIIEITK